MSLDRLPSKSRITITLALALLIIRIALGSFFVSASDLTPDNIISGVNSQRTQRNIPALAYNSKLAAAAEYKANDMITRKYFAHVDPDGHYIWDKIVAEGYTPYSILGENLAVDFSDTEGLIAAWMDSPTHRENILNQNFKDQGMGVDFGNSANGEFSVAIANTFGAQPAATPKPVPAPAPVPIAKTPPPPPQPAPKPTPAPAPAPPSSTPPNPNLPQINISNSTPIIYNNSVLINGKTSQNIQVQIKDLSQNNSQPVSIQSDSSGVFSYTFNNLSNGSHKFEAKIIGANGAVYSNTYNATIAYNPPVISPENISAAITVAGGKMDIHVDARIDGAVTAANATVGDQSSQLVLNASGTYSGDLLFDQYYNYQGQNLVVSAQNEHQNSATARLPLAGVELGSPNPKSITGQLSQKIGNPDLYNVFKYVVIVFGGLFIVFLLIDSFKSGKNKISDIFSAGNGSILVILIISTALIVSWWH